MDNFLCATIFLYNKGDEFKLKRKTKGFTLIELLSVIVILTIIALISVPVVLNIINDTRREAAQKSVEGVIDAAKKYCALKMVNNEDLTGDVTVKCNSSTNECKVTENQDIIKIDGNLPDGTFTINSNCVINPIKESALILDNYAFQIRKSAITQVMPAEDSKLITFCENNICEVDSFIQGLAIMDLEDGTYTFSINNENYVVELINYTNDVVLTENTSFGDSTNEYKTLLVKFHGDLTISSGVTVTANTFSGYTYKKGMYLYVGGTLTNNGTISMTARGTYNLAGQNTYLWKNKDESYETLAALGATGGVGRTGSYQANKGNDGSTRQTGGGGAGAGRNYNNTGYGGSGGRGTTFSGGAGGGGGAGTSASSRTGGTGSSIGGEGGIGRWMGGGAGNPGGGGSGVGNFGTGGLLVLYADNLINNGTISSNGSNGGTATDEQLTGGGGSGGGSINIFYKSSITKGTITANGGAGGAAAKGKAGGIGGAGTINSCSIATGSCVLDI